MSQRPDPNADLGLGARLSDLASRTANISARPGFSARVMQRLEGEEPLSTLLQLRLPAWRVFPALVLTAAIALVSALSANNAVNEALAVSYDDVEVGW